MSKTMSDELKKIERLEKEEVGQSQELTAIQSLDELMQNDDQSPNVDFTSQVVEAAVIARRKKVSQQYLLATLVFMLFSVVSIIGVVLLTGENLGNVNSNYFKEALRLLDAFEFKRLSTRLVLITEAVIGLLILERVIFRITLSKTQTSV